MPGREGMAEVENAEQDRKKLSRCGNGCGNEGTVPRDRQEDKYLPDANNTVQYGNVESELLVLFQETDALPPLTGSNGQRKQQAKGIHIDVHHCFDGRWWPLLVFLRTGSF